MKKCSKTLKSIENLTEVVIKERLLQYLDNKVPFAPCLAQDLPQRQTDVRKIFWFDHISLKGWFQQFEASGDNLHFKANELTYLYPNFWVLFMAQYIFATLPIFFKKIIFDIWNLDGFSIISEKSYFSVFPDSGLI